MAQKWRCWPSRNAAVAGFADQYRDRPAGAIIIDPSNPFLWHDDGAMTIKDLGGKSSATVTAKLFPRSSVARPFSHQLAETLSPRGRREAGLGRSDTRQTTMTLQSPSTSSPKPASYQFESARSPSRPPSNPAERSSLAC